jgi:hypothetical protein
MDRSARRVVKGVKPEDVLRLEVALQKLVLEPRGGLTALCLLNADMSRTLVAPIVEQTTAFLSHLLPVTDVTEVEVSAARGRKADLPARSPRVPHRATPACGSDAGAQSFVLVPDSESGKAFAELVRKAVPAALTIPVNGAATDLMFCRERGNLSPAEVSELLAACQPAYYQSLASPQTAPHARFDITEWLPLGE